MVKDSPSESQYHLRKTNREAGRFRCAVCFSMAFSLIYDPQKK